MPAATATRRRPIADILDEAATEAQAVELLVAQGHPRADAEETAAIAFGTGGDDVEVLGAAAGGD